MPALGSLATVVRSKNAGPHVITFDIIFSTRDMYEAVRKTEVIAPALFARLYGVDEDACEFHEYETAYAFKCSIPRAVASGDIGDPDVYGAQQHVPLLTVDVPI